jgi:predicted metal-dependent hydrolase
LQLYPDAGHAPLLQVQVPLLAEEQHIKASVQVWLKQQAEQHFRQRLDHFAPMLQVRWTRLALSNAATRWGSAKSDGSIRLNWRLMHLQPAVLDYVVVHELSHLREMNHGPRFWSTVHSVMPDYLGLRKQLKESPAPGW